MGRGFSLAIILVLSLAAPVLAQTDTQSQPPRPGRAFRGLFGGVERDPTRYRSLDLTISLLGGYDDNISPEGGSGGDGGGGGDPRFTQNGGLGNASAALAYRRGRNENWFSAGARTGFRYYPSLTELNSADYSGNIGFTSRPSARTQLSARQDVSYQPYFSLLAVPVFLPEPAGGLTLATTDYSFADRPSIGYNTSVNAGYDLSRRTHATAAYFFRGLDFTGEGDDGRLREHHGQVGMNREVTRRWSVGGRYVHTRGENSYTSEGFRTLSHGGDLTLDYRRTLRSRRTLTLGFAPGFSRVEGENEVAGRRIDRRLTATLHAGIDVVRTWTVNGDYRRGLRFLPGIRQPLFADDVEVRVSGQVGRRVDLSFSSQYSEGEPALETSGFTSLSGRSQLRVAVSASAALSAQYVYYRYEFGPEAVLPEGVGRRFNRHAFRLGVDVWLPLFR